MSDTEMKCVPRHEIGAGMANADDVKTSVAECCAGSANGAGGRRSRLNCGSSVDAGELAPFLSSLLCVERSR